MSSSAPIGVFDSGIGGLTVVREMIGQLPNESIIYFGDTARMPYGPKSPDTVLRYSREITSYLLAEGVKALVVACNTATAHALPALREEFAIPIIGVIEPGARAAVASTKSNRIGVIGTAGTIKSRAYEKEIKKLLPNANVTAQACALFAPLVEEGWLDSEVTRAVARNYLAPIVSAEVDTLVLGCTHYPLIKALLRRVAPAHVSIVDSAHSTAHAVAKRVEDFYRNTSRDATGQPTLKFFATDSVEKFRRLGPSFLGHPVDSVEHVDLKE
jgi:glutamate racemase